MHKYKLTFKVLMLGDNFFCASFYNPQIHKTSHCYITDRRDVNTEIIESVVNNSTLIGFGNKTYDNIFLSYILHNRYVKIDELYGVRKCIEENIPDIDFYRSGFIDSFDLKTESPIDFVDEEPCPEYDGDIYKILSFNSRKVQEYASNLDELKRYMNYGFTKLSKNRFNSEKAKYNLIKELIGL
jgi:hypothetical protein